MSGLSKIVIERNQKTLLDLASQPGNDICADCKARHPRWASFNLGIFLCVNCASIHRKIGTHITKVKSITMDSWTKEQVERMREMGNLNSNAIYNPNEQRHPPPPNTVDPERDSELEVYIRGKYEFKKFFDKGGFVASRLGPSRSAASMRSPSPNSPKAPPSPNPARSTTLPPSAPQSAAAVPQQPARSQTSLVTPVSPPPRTSSQSGSTQQNGGVWNDLVSLQPGSSSGTLPLQVLSTEAQAQAQSLGLTSPPLQSIGTGVQQFQPQFSTLPTPQMPPIQTGLAPIQTGFFPMAANGPVNPFLQMQQQSPMLGQQQSFIAQSPVMMHPQGYQQQIFQPQAAYSAQQPMTTGFYSPQMSNPSPQSQFMHTPSPQPLAPPSPYGQPQPQPTMQNNFTGWMQQQSPGTWGQM